MLGELLVAAANADLLGSGAAEARRLMESKVRGCKLGGMFQLFRQGGRIG